MLLGRQLSIRLFLLRLFNTGLNVHKYYKHTRHCVVEYIGGEGDYLTENR